MALNVLEQKTREVVAASYALPNLETAIQQVIYNCIDAHAKSICLSVDIARASFTAEDDGDGIQPNDLIEYIGVCYASSRLPISKSDSEQKQHKAYGSRGAFLYELTSLAETVEIESRVQEHWTSYRKTFKDGEVVFNARSKQLREVRGTKVSVSNLFRKCPVRRKDLSRNTKYRTRVIQNIHNFCVSMSMIWPSLSLNVKFEGDQTRPLTIPSAGSCNERFLAHFGQILGHDLQYVTYAPQKKSFSIRGYFAFVPVERERLAQGIKQAKSYYQFAFLENEWVEDCQEVCSRAITEAAVNFFSAIPIYVVKISVPHDQYDISRTGSETHVVFKAPELLKQFLYEFVQNMVTNDEQQTRIQQAVQEASHYTQEMPEAVPKKYPDCAIAERPASSNFHDALTTTHRTDPFFSDVLDYENATRSTLQNQEVVAEFSLMRNWNSAHLDSSWRDDERHSTLPNVFEDHDYLADQNGQEELISDVSRTCVACGHFINSRRDVMEEAHFEVNSEDFKYNHSSSSVGIHVVSEKSDVGDSGPQEEVDKAKSDFEVVFFSGATNTSSMMRGGNLTTAKGSLKSKTGINTPWLSSKPDLPDYADIYLNLSEDDNIGSRDRGGQQNRSDFDRQTSQPMIEQVFAVDDTDTSTFGGAKSSYFAGSASISSRTQFARAWCYKKAIPVKHLSTALQVDNFHTQRENWSIKISKTTLANLEVIRQVDRKFILVQADTSRGRLLLCIDQHAADERVRLEKLELDMFGRDGSLRRVDIHTHEPPLSLLLNFKERGVLHHHEELIRSWGFDFEGVNQEHNFQFERATTANCDEGRVLLHATPKVDKRVTNVGDFRDFLQLLSNAGATYLYSHIRPPAITRLLHSRACRSAIMFGDWLSIGQCKDLVEELKTCQLPFQCAHGRPSVVPLAEIHCSDTSDSSSEGGDLFE